MTINHYYLFIFLFTKIPIHSLTTVHDVNQAAFINPQTNIALIQCPLELDPNFNILWYDVANNRYDEDRGLYYPVHASQSNDRILICSWISKDGLESDEAYKIQVRVYDHPLPVRRISIAKTSQTNFTVLWNDDHYNRNANITGYNLSLKRNNTILQRILVNHTESNFTFLSLSPNTLYTVEILAVDSWKRHSQSKFISEKTLPLNITDRISSHKIIDRRALDRSLSCYKLNAQLLLIEFNRSEFRQLNYVYNLTIYNNHNHKILTDNLYSAQQRTPIMKTSNSFIYQLKHYNIRYKIKLAISTEQLEHLGMIEKYCQDFYPVYTPLTCSLKPMKQHSYYLVINTHLYNNHKNIISLKPSYVFYQINRQLVLKQNISDIYKYATATIVDVKGNYSLIVENNLIDSEKNDKLNISILCSVNRQATDIADDRMSIGIIITLILLAIIFLTILLLIAYQQGVLSGCHRVLLQRVSSLQKSHYTKSCLIQNNYCTDKNTDGHLDIFQEEYLFSEIPVDQFCTYVTHMHKDDNFGFVRLFENVSEHSKKHRFSVNVSQTEHNQCKNRYIDVLTYDHSRVKLSSADEQESDSYINANYVDGFGKTNAYIATQGPMINTINDFWRMIWEKNVNVLVMITNIKECGRIKCDMYWPQEGTITYGIIQVTLVETISMAYYIKRIFSIQSVIDDESTNQRRTIHQFHYTNWPDHGVPLFTMPVLSFIRRSSACNNKSDGPIVVHCSAGVGRTGTYIVIDTMMKKINEHEPLDIPTFLKHIRQQRNFLVQTEEQFVFIYDVLYEVAQLSSIGCTSLELTVDNIDSILQKLERYDEDSTSHVEKQFKLILDQPKINNQELSVAQMKENMRKNRSLNILPLNSCRVLLSGDGKMRATEYINASYVHGYYRVDEFIITQHPMMNTIVDFWRMIWNNSVDTIISLYGDEKLQADIPDFWPSANRYIDCGNFNIYLIEERYEYEYIYRKIALRSVEGNYECQARLISSTFWPEACAPIETSFNLINQVKGLKPSGPIVVHDLCGGYRAGTFCALYTMKEQIEAESVLNVYELARFYYLKRPGLWRNHNDLLFLYRCAESLFHSNKLSNNGEHSPCARPS